MAVNRHSLNTREDTAAPLWERSFMCKVPQLQTTSIEYLQRFGMVSSGDKNIDRELANQLITTFLPIHQLAEYHRDGVPVYMCRRDDLEVIYDLVDKHLHAWKMHMGTGLNKAMAPIDDLIALDSFANSLFGYTKFVMVEGEQMSPFMRWLNGTSASNLMRSVDVDLSPSSHDEIQELTRDSFADVFKKSVSRESLRRWD